MDKNFNKSDFLNNYQDKKPIVFKNCFDVNSLSWEKINEIIERSNIHSDDFKVAYQGIVDKGCYIETFDEVGITRYRLMKPVIYNLLKNGATLIANKIVNEPAIDEFARQIARLTGRQTVTSMYVAFGDKDSYKAHWDTRDVFAIQIKGRKRWVIYEPTFPNPLYMQQSKYFEETHPCPDMPYMDIILEEGDMLYVPCGWWHNPSPLGEETVHLAIGTFPAFGLDYMEWLLKKLPDFHEIRKPMSNWQNDNANLAIIANQIQELMTNQSTYNEFMQEFIGEKRVESNLALELLGDGKINELPMTAMLRLNSNQPYNENDEFIIANGAKLTLDNEFKEIILYIANHSVVSVSDIFDNFKDIEQEKLMNALYGLCLNDIVEVVSY
ncbi:cupin domain-containing protein [Moraxella nasibovis]|uniref:JmjC domain-containing protein n=1 Tax=Moraxella nasibovis TaxID=2904120 RepID=UPI00240F4E4D|nr:cupin domain-containing protein [Moraxella nasibovis]WFF38436.1 cupin domain-containing protein [Moraxella nasibovis]